MPLRDFSCSACDRIDEEFMRHWDDAVPPCPICGGPRVELASRFGIVFTGSLGTKYNDPKRENAHMEGYWAYRKRSSISGQPEPVFLQTHQEVREFCKAEGLYDPADVPRNMQMSADGKSLSSNGMPGQWSSGSVRDLVPSRVWEMDTSLTSLSGKEPAPQASGPPCAAGVADASMISELSAKAGG